MIHCIYLAFFLFDMIEMKESSINLFFQSLRVP